MAFEATPLTSLFAAVANQDFATADQLLSQGLSINDRLEESSMLTRAAMYESLPSVRWLIGKGIDLNYRDKDELTALAIACIGKKKGSQIARELIAAGCDVMVRREDDGMSALEFAAKNSDPDVIRLLVEKGLPVDGLKDCKKTPAMLAALANNVENLKMLVELGADLSKKCKLPWANGLTCLEMAEQEKCRKSVAYLKSLK